MRHLTVTLGIAVALSACDSRGPAPEVQSQTPPAPQQQQLSPAQEEAIAQRVAERLAAQKAQDEADRLTREEEIRKQVRKEVEDELARRATERAEAEQPAPSAPLPPPTAQQVGMNQPMDPSVQAPAQMPAPADEAGYAMFYEALRSYGSWYQAPEYGYVWQPFVAARNPNWRPYTDGQWVDSEQGWVWVSNEPFGWATYHYGRWVALRDMGWVWVPGTEWAPAWVIWRQSDEYVGWGPLPPESSDLADVGGWVDSYYDFGPGYYSFIPIAQFCAPSYAGVIVNPYYNVQIIERTKNVTCIYRHNKYVYNCGPRRQDLQNHCPNQIKVRPIARVNSEVEVKKNRNGDTLVFYAPNVTRRDGSPRTVVSKLDGKEVQKGWEQVKDTNEKTRLQQTLAKSGGGKMPEKETRNEGNNGNPMNNAAREPETKVAVVRPDSLRAGNRDDRPQSSGPENNRTPQTQDFARQQNQNDDRERQRRRDEQEQGERENERQRDSARQQQEQQDRERERQQREREQQRVEQQQREVERQQREQQRAEQQRREMERQQREQQARLEQQQQYERQQREQQQREQQQRESERQQREQQRSASQSTSSGNGNGGGGGGGGGNGGNGGGGGNRSGSGDEQEDGRRRGR